MNTIEVLRCTFLGSPSNKITINIREVADNPTESQVEAFMEACVHAKLVSANTINEATAIDKADMVTTTIEEIYNSEAV